MIIFSLLLYYFILIPLSLLPFRVLYAISDFIYLLLYRVVGYRKKVVRENLKNSFPEKSERELQDIERKFYRHFCDLIVESIKLFTISSKALLKRLKIVNSEMLNQYQSQGKSVIAVTGHYGNWEWVAVTLPFHSKQKGCGIYLPLTNKFFNDKMQRSRSRWGIELMSVKEVSKFFEDHKNQAYIYGFIADQSPSNPDRAIWVNFLNRDTACLAGTERYSKEYDVPVVFGEIKKIKRGYYELHYHLLVDKPLETSDGEITRIHTSFLEKMILRQPEYWLWSHRRWKLKKKSGKVE